ncbi:MAG: HD domain-containing protein [Candidatus Aminicenantales bacterium]
MAKVGAVNVISDVNARFPGLTAKIKGFIEKAEREFSGKPEPQKSFLWEHTTHVASICHGLARAEGRDPVIPAVAALFHDAGKFAGGGYHEGHRTEEEEAAKIAERILRDSGMTAKDRQRVTAGLRRLYHPGARKNFIADAVHDADFLSKFGALGIANFFIKSTLRGKTLRDAIMNQLSKELTYAVCLPFNMRTLAGRRLAGKKAKDTMTFFRSLLGELKQAGIADFTIKKLQIKGRAFAAELDPRAKPGALTREVNTRLSAAEADPQTKPGAPAAAPSAVATTSPPRRSVGIRLAVPRFCGVCGGRWKISIKTEPGIKCEKLEAGIVCARCGAASSFSFCLPEIRGMQ